MSETTKMKTEIDQLRALRDEVRVKLHLARMDAKDRWRELEPRVTTVIEEAANETAKDSRKILSDTIKALEQLRDSI